MSKFEVGDRVKILSADNPRLVGEKGTILEIDNEWHYPYYVKFDSEELDNEVVMGSLQDLFLESELELIDLELVFLNRKVRWFAGEMKKVLESKVHLHPTRWDNDTTEVLLDRLDDKVDDLYLALGENRVEDIAKLATDIANFAMMIADKNRITDKNRVEDSE